LIAWWVCAALASASCGRSGAEAPGEPAVASRPVTLEHARQVYARACASCHGSTGRGDGHRASRLRQHPTDFSDAGWQAKISDAEIKEQIMRGSGPMPSFRLRLTEPEIDRLVEVVRGFGTAR